MHLFAGVLTHSVRGSKGAQRLSSSRESEALSNDRGPGKNLHQKAARSSRSLLASGDSNWYSTTATAIALLLYLSVADRVLDDFDLLVGQTIEFVDDLVDQLVSTLDLLI
jgi:hypothetical protein